MTKTGKEIERIITAWVKKSYGENEAENPSWDIKALAEELDHNVYHIHHDIEFENELENVKLIAEYEGIELTEQEAKDATNEYMISNEYRSLDQSWDIIKHYIEEVKGE